MITVLLIDSKDTWIGFRRLPYSIMVKTMAAPIALPRGESNCEVLNKAVGGAHWCERGFEDDTGFCKCISLEMVCAWCKSLHHLSVVLTDCTNDGKFSISIGVFILPFMVINGTKRFWACGVNLWRKSARVRTNLYSWSHHLTNRTFDILFWICLRDSLLFHA